MIGLHWFTHCIRCMHMHITQCNGCGHCKMCIILCELQTRFVHCTVAYLGFQKEGAKFSLATSAYTSQRGAKPYFPIFSYSEKKFFLAKWGPWPNGPLNMPLTLYNVSILPKAHNKIYNTICIRGNQSYRTEYMNVVLDTVQMSCCTSYENKHTVKTAVLYLCNGRQKINKSAINITLISDRCRQHRTTVHRSYSACWANDIHSIMHCQVLIRNYITHAR